MASEHMQLSRSLAFGQKNNKKRFLRVGGGAATSFVPSGARQIDSK
jgi:hypothetical protein